MEKIGSTELYGEALPSPSPSIPHIFQVEGRNWVQPIAPAEEGPMLQPCADSTSVIAASTLARRPNAFAAARAFGLRASVLAAITEIESGHGCNMGPSSAGAIGWTQFMPATWKMWGMDADGDGKASPYNSVDAIFSTARYLRSSGAPRNYRKALYAYNHAGWYVNKVLAASKRYR